MTSVKNIFEATNVYTKLNEAYTKLLNKKVLSSDDRIAIAVFFEHMSRDHHDYATAIFLEDVAAKFRKDFIIPWSDRELILGYLLSALTSACEVLRNCGVEVHDNEEIAA